MVKAADTIEKHPDGLLAHGIHGGLSPGFLEGLNSVFSALKRKAGGYRSRDYMIPMRCFVADKLSMPPLSSQWKRWGTEKYPLRKPAETAGLWLFSTS